MAGIILDPGTIAEFLKHFEVETGPLFQALGLEEFILGSQFLQSLRQFDMDILDCALHPLLGGDVVASRIDGDFVQPLGHLSPQGVYPRNSLYLIAEKLDADGLVFLIRGEDLHDIPPYPKCPPMKIDVVSLILNFHELIEDFLPWHRSPSLQKEEQAVIGLGRSQPIDTGNTGHNDYIISIQQGSGG